VVPTFQDASKLASIAFDHLPRFFKWAAGSDAKKAFAYISMGSLCALLFLGTLVLIQTIASTDHRTRRAPLNGQVEDERYLVAIDTVTACIDENRDSRRVAQSVCLKAVREYKAVFPHASIQDDVKIGDFYLWRVELNHALRLQQQSRAVDVPETFIEIARNVIFSETGVLVLFLLMVVLPEVVLWAFFRGHRAALVGRRQGPFRRTFQAKPIKRIRLRKLTAAMRK
jgi:hypothetical protein